MIRRTVRVVAALGVLGGLGFALAKLVQGRRSNQPRLPSGDEQVVPKRSETPLVEPKMLHSVTRKVTDPVDPEPDEAPPAPRLIGAQAPPAASAARTASPAAQAEVEAGAGAGARPGPQPWVDPDGAICPSSHPVKAKLASGIFHLPGMTAYERTTPDRCYPSEEAAEADGLRKAKR